MCDRPFLLGLLYLVAANAPRPDQNVDRIIKVFDHRDDYICQLSTADRLILD